MKCKHNWKEDERFRNGEVMMFFGDIGNIKRESRFVCVKCGSVDYKQSLEEKK